eukprot:RCo030750
MGCCGGWVVVVLLLLEWKLGLVRLLLRTLRHTFERYTAPRIAVDLPPVKFSASPSPTPLNPRSSPTPGTIQCYDKGTNTPLGTARAIPPEEVVEIVARARAAQRRWAQTSFSTRRKLMFALLDYVLAHQGVLCETACVECGKTMMDGSLGEILTTLEKLRWTAAEGEDVLRTEVREVGLIAAHKRAMVSYVPFGVIGAIVSWNYPFHNIYGPMISALFAGNAFVGKVSEYTSFYAGYYEAIVREGLKSLGQSPDLVSFLTGFAETGEALVAAVDKVTFIGSPGVGKLIMRKASETLTPVVLELGGKDPAVVLEDADLGQVIPILLRGTFQNCGQNCIGLERVLLHTSIHDKVVSALLETVKGLSQGPSSAPPVKDLGAMTMGGASVKKIQKLLDDSVKAGAKVLAGGKATSDNFFPPTLITNVTVDTPIANEEVFGPILVVMKFESDEEATEIVNRCPYGLGSSVFSGNVARARAIADRIVTGMVNVNDFGINYLCQSLPFGGVKISGFDRFAGREGLRGNCVARASTEDRIPGVKTSIPPILQYPVTEAAFAFTEHLNRVLYGTLAQMVTSGVALATFKAPAKK